MKKYIQILILIALFGCNKTSSIEHILSHVWFDIPQNYQVIESSNDWALGESSDFYEILVERAYSEKSRKVISELIFFKEYSFDERVEHVLDDLTTRNQKSEFAWRKNESVHYQLFEPDPGFILTVSFRNDTIMIIRYEDL